MSQTATTQPPLIKSRIGAILRATSGNFLEQFDFFLFGFYASAIAKAFFPAQNETAALLNAFGVFWLGALMRPVGAIVLGAYIDRIGRRKGLIVTLAHHGDRHGGDRVLPDLCDHRHRRAGHRADRPAAAGLFRRRRARRRLGLSRPRSPRPAIAASTPRSSRPASRSRSSSPRSSAIVLSESDAGGHRRGLGLAHSVLRRLPDHSR